MLRRDQIEPQAIEVLSREGTAWTARAQTLTDQKGTAAVYPMDPGENEHHCV
jgi:hypothetical protein